MTRSDTDIRLAEMIATRLCHELAAPSGALNNGIELLSLAPGSPDPEVLSLIGDGGARLVALLKFWRFVYGVSAEGTVPLAEVKALAEGFAARGRVALAWDGAAPAALPRGGARLLLALAAMAAQAAPRGGTVTLAPSEAGPVVTLEAEAIDPAKGHWQVAEAAFAGALDVAGLDSRSVHAAYTGRLAAELALTLVAERDGPGRLTIGATLKG
ncbi:MAG: histidine phosphotransferase family protein [Acetobacterales bacterium]